MRQLLQAAPLDTRAVLREAQHRRDGNILLPARGFGKHVERHSGEGVPADNRLDAGRFRPSLQGFEHALGR
jgi:hypothetical protein